MKNQLLKIALFVGIPAILFAASARIKDFGTTATTVNNDDYVPIDGATSGTRKILGARFLTNASVTGTGNVVFDTSPTFPSNLTITGNATPSTTTAGTISFDTNAWAASRGSFQAYDGTANIILLGALASDTPSNGQVPTWNTAGTITWETPPSGMGGNYTVTGNVVASSGNVTIQSASGQNITLTPGAGGAIIMGTVNATAVNAGNITGATGNLQLFVGNSTTGNFTIGNLVEGTGIDITKGATDVTITSTAASNIIVGNTTVTTNSTGNLTLIAGDNITLTANNTNKSVTINATGGGSGAETGDVKFILDSASVPSGWALTGVNGIAAFTTPDADYKPVIKMAGTVATPTFSPAAGAVASGTTITFSSATSGVTFMTTNNTTDPSRSVGTAGGTWTVSANQTLEVMAYKDGAYLIDSAIASAAYTITAGSPTWYYPPGITSNPAALDDNNVVDNAYAGLSKITFSSAGTVTKLGFWTKYTNATSTLKMAVYDSSRVLIGSGVSASITTGNDVWQEITASVTIPSAGTYYIGLSVDGPFDGSLVGKRTSTSSGDDFQTYDSGSYGNFPGSLTGLASGSYPWAVRAELTP
jgi:hypothetical protein